eukprot:CAMPEP_0173282396 /NCGR_PEP_ID=MMETSP1143-20121109/6789_1 /TAXON_ID=483371 /ORGANISM="non described non described, Strain CCMP2298" /LENGTH=418 /DNA_ID=CAMNT_0014219947 /DNA_START=166 /DNA_END=1422 /DNA_ORIENTATION=-
MRALGYPRLISMENFRKPNFELVADILYWMVKLYDPETTLSDRVEFENERVQFLTGIAVLMATKARLKLNTKKLYASDGRAVQELLKLASLLYKATSTAARKFEEEGVPPPIKMQEVKVARQLASDITQSGATLYDLMENEADDRVERARALRFLDLAASTSEGPREQQYIERSIRDVIDSTKQGLEDSRKECEELEADERNLESKILKKSEELERTEKRLKSLENVRPQFMEEAEKLEKELQRYYEVYMDKHRNLDYLEFELDKYKRSEEERMAEHERKLRKMRERLLREEVDLLRGGREESETKNGGGAGEAGAGSGSGAGRSRVQGSMAGAQRGGASDGESSDDDESDSGNREGSDEEEEISLGDKRSGAGRQGGAARPARAEEEDYLDDGDEEGEDEEDDAEDDGEFSGSDGDF